MILASITKHHLVLFFSFIIVLSFSFLWYSVDISKYSSVCAVITHGAQNKTSKAETTDIIVLVWNWPWGERFALDKCPEFGYPECNLSVNRSLYSTADAVIIHHADIMDNKNALPQQPRPSFQHWVWLNLEPPMIIRNLEMLDNLFNMTMTFRRDSTIFIPYGQMETLKEPQNVTIPMSKSKLVSWVVSKWYPGAPRIAYYNELKKYIEIDVYGAKHKPLSLKDFHSTISQYKFYLAFENSIYRDYITEKFWSNAHRSWAVPVVLGTTRENYERFAPGDSFIHINDFPSAKELADYLHELDKDDAKYQKYFEWRSRYRVKRHNGWPYSYCKACEILRKSSTYQVVHKLAKWFLHDV